jgi:hypothetical protein
MVAEVTEGPDWVAWHRPYDDPASPLSRRLVVVQAQVRACLDAAPSGVIRVVSMCAGQGRDVLGVLEDHPRRDDVTARLVERDLHNADEARLAVEEASLTGVEVVTGDAAVTDAYVGAVPADLVMVCGVFGNIVDSDIERTIAHLPMLCAPAATVIWTRHRRPPDTTGAVRRWFAERGFEEVTFEAPAGYVFTVGVHRLVRPPDPLVPGVTLFTFRGDGSLPA